MASPETNTSPEAWNAIYIGRQIFRPERALRSCACASVNEMQTTGGIIFTLPLTSCPDRLLVNVTPHRLRSGKCMRSGCPVLPASPRNGRLSAPPTTCSGSSATALPGPPPHRDLATRKRLRMRPIARLNDRCRIAPPIRSCLRRKRQRRQLRGLRAITFLFDRLSGCPHALSFATFRTGSMLLPAYFDSI
jgi:hypothetical protein